MLELDTLDVMFDYPLDYDIEEGGTFYFDPELNPEVNPYTWQYVVVPINKPLPNVPYERLSELVLDVVIDDFNQKSIFGGDRPNDRIKGYSLQQIESLLFGLRFSL